MSKRILVPLDGSALAECVLPHTVAMARAFDAQVSLLEVVEQPVAADAMASIDPLSWRLKKNEAELYLNKIKTRLEASDLRLEVDLLEGRAPDQIMKYAHDKAADLLILSSYGHDDRAYHANVSPAVQQILQSRFISTLIVRSKLVAAEPAVDDLHYKRILVPLDGSRRAESVLPTVTMLAQVHQSEILLVHIVHAPDMPRRMPLADEDAELVHRLITHNQDEGEQYLAQLQTRLPPQTRTILQVSSNVTTAIQDIAEREQADLMILSAHGYSGGNRWPYGNVTNRFIADGTTPLLVIQDLPFETAEPELQVNYTTRPAGR